MLGRLGRAAFRPALSFIGLLSFIASFFGSRFFATLYPNIVVQQQGIHFHHFWYGIGLLAVAGWLAITWKNERLDRVYAVMYGLGAGFIGDEVGLLLTFGYYESELTYEFFIGAVSTSILLFLGVRYRATVKREISYLMTREGLALFGVFVTGFSFILFAFGSFSFATPVALVGIIVILREVFSKPDTVLESKTPRGITVLAALSILGGADLVLAGVGLLLFPPVVNATELVGVKIPSEVLSLITTIFEAIALAAMALGSLKIFTGLVLRTGKSWAWMLGIVTSIVSLFLDAGQVGIGSFSIIGNLIEFPTSIVAIVYLTRPHVRAFYRKAASLVPRGSLEQATQPKIL